eukprot:CAMPEP_0177768150 /NCGR_PEP_ID=MMETSP0491_2-20121128/9556_1 /TAXON_ID=63592 /ORGANISM="Tetraselmis chuii, Strain PLY429" /LENGTH=130 /DNA_ID=CAMNT_0019284915 /DNA_START=201 /DNA_END=590 /DNA_ORIENTATION=-
MPPGAGLCTEPASTGPQLLVGGKLSDPRLLPAGIGRYMIYVKEGAEKRAAVQAALKEHMGSSYKEANVLKIIPMFVAEIEKDKLVELLTSDSFQSVRELMGGCVTIEPDGVVSIPEQPGDMMHSGMMKGW